MRIHPKAFSWSDVPLLCLILLIFLYEARLGTNHAIYLWDESIYANNSLEMERSGNFLVYTVDGTVDHHNSKPPLVLWLQVISYKILGYNEVAVRFPSFLAFFGTLGLCLFYARKLCGNIRPGIIACLVILVTPGLIRPHVFLTGDLDAMLVFGCSFIFLHHLKVIGQEYIAPKDVYIYAVLFIAGFLTKSTAILLIVPGLLLSFIISGQLRKLLTQAATYLAGLLFAGVVVGYYLIRERYDPGYWNVVWFSEFKRVAVNIQPWLTYPWNVYFVFLRDQFFRYPLMLLAVAGPAFLLIPGLPHKKPFVHALIIATAYLLVISVPPVKLIWYDAPVYPLLAFSIGLALHGLAGFGLARVGGQRLRDVIWFAGIVSLMALAFLPFRKRLKAETEGYYIPEASTNALREFSKRGRLDQVRVIEEVNDRRFIHALDGLRFYQKTLQLNSGTRVNISSYTTDIRPHETVIICQQAKLDSVLLRLPAIVTDSCDACKLVQVN